MQTNKEVILTEGMWKGREEESERELHRQTNKQQQKRQRPGRRLRESCALRGGERGKLTEEEAANGRSREREGEMWRREAYLVAGKCFCVCALTSESESQHFPCGADECKRVAVGGWKAELWQHAVTRGLPQSASPTCSRGGCWGGAGPGTAGNKRARWNFNFNLTITAAELSYVRFNVILRLLISTFICELLEAPTTNSLKEAKSSEPKVLQKMRNGS